jgi:hypothetical protein
MPTAPPIPVAYPVVAPKSRTESGIRYLSYAMILFALTTAANIAFLFLLFPLIAEMMTFTPGTPPDPAVFSSLLAVIGAGCAISLLSLVGGILGLIGLIGVYQGGDEFGPEHARRVQRGLIVVIVGIIAPFVGQIPLTFLAMTSSPFLGSSIIPTFNPAVIWTQLAFGLTQAILLGLFLLWSVDTLATPSGLTRATWAFILGLVGVGASGLGGLVILTLVPLPTRLDEVTPLFLAPSAIGQAISILSLVVWYHVYSGVLERFRRGELVARPPAMYWPAAPYYPGYYSANPMPPSASPAQPQGPPPSGPPEKPPGS